MTKPLIEEVIITPKKPIYKGEDMDDMPNDVFRSPRKNLIDEVEL